MVHDEYGGVDVQDLIRQIAATGADPAWVAECVQIEQDDLRSRAAAIAEERRTRARAQLRVVGGRDVANLG
jgi:hypothetical protein